MLISPDAAFDRDAFVFRGSNPLGSCFRKSPGDVRCRHRDGGVNTFYRQLLGDNGGNAVLQVAYVEWEHVFRNVAKAVHSRKETGFIMVRRMLCIISIVAMLTGGQAKL